MGKYTLASFNLAGSVNNSTEQVAAHASACMNLDTGQLGYSEVHATTSSLLSLPTF